MSNNTRRENGRHLLNESYSNVTKTKVKQMHLPLKNIKSCSLLFSVLFTIITLAIDIPLQVDNNQVFAQSVDNDLNAKFGNSTSEKHDPFNSIQDTAKTIIASSAGSVSESQISAQSSGEIYGDFNGDGTDDLAIGVPGENNDAGAVNVLYGSSNGLSATSPRPDQFWTQDSPDVNDFSEQNDGFGSSLAAGDFNGDGRDDLAIGVPGENNLAGAVNVLYGSSNGLSATSPRSDQFWTQSTADVNDLSELADVFGFSLTSGDFNADGRDDLAIGVFAEDLVTASGNQIDAGAVNVLYGSSNGLSATSPRPDQFWTQDSPDVNDILEGFDSFGSSLAAGDFNGDGRDDLAIGVGDESVNTGAGSIPFAGAVNVLYGSSNGLSATSPRPDQFWTQDSPDVNEVPEEGERFGWSLAAGDFNGDGRDDLAIGVDRESVNTAASDVGGAGAVNVLYGSSNGLSATSPRPDQFWTQDSPDVNGGSESSDNFGFSLTSGDFNGDGTDDLAIGVPGENNDAGAVNVLYGSSSGLSATSPRSDQSWTQDSTDVNDFSEVGDDFGHSVASADFNGDGRDDLAVGVDHEDVNTAAGSVGGAGAVNVLYGSSNGLSATSPRPDQFWTQSTADVNDLSEVSDHFGQALG